MIKLITSLKHIGVGFKVVTYSVIGFFYKMKFPEQISLELHTDMLYVLIIFVIGQHLGLEKEIINFLCFLIFMGYYI